MYVCVVYACLCVCVCVLVCVCVKERERERECENSITFLNPNLILDLSGDSALDGPSPGWYTANTLRWNNITNTVGSSSSDGKSVCVHGEPAGPSYVYMTVYE
jgi:hypothetical protein